MQLLFIPRFRCVMKILLEISYSQTKLTRAIGTHCSLFIASLPPIKIPLNAMHYKSIAIKYMNLSIILPLILESLIKSLNKCLIQTCWLKKWA